MVSLSFRQTRLTGRHTCRILAMQNPRHAEASPHRLQQQTFGDPDGFFYASPTRSCTSASVCMHVQPGAVTQMPLMKIFHLCSRLINRLITPIIPTLVFTSECQRGASSLEQVGPPHAFCPWPSRSVYPAPPRPCTAVWMRSASSEWHYLFIVARLRTQKPLLVTECLTCLTPSSMDKLGQKNYLCVEDGCSADSPKSDFISFSCFD